MAEEVHASLMAKREEKTRKRALTVAKLKLRYPYYGIPILINLMTF